MITGPTVSIGLPVFNGECYLSQAIESVLAQSFKDFELFISDNASTDSTWDICQSYAKQDRRVLLHRNPVNVGLNKNFSLVVRETPAPYFMWMAHDDILDSRYLCACLDFLQDHPDYVLCYSANDTIDEAGKSIEYFEDSACEVDSDDLVERFAQCMSKLYPSVSAYGLFRKDALVKTREWSPSLPPHGQDYVRLLEMSLLGKFHYIPETMRSYRIKTAASVRSKNFHDRLVQHSLAYSGDNRVPMIPSIRCAMRMLSIALLAKCNRSESLKLASIVIRSKLFLSLWYRDIIMLQKLATYRFPGLYEKLGKINRMFLTWAIKRFKISMRVDPSLFDEM
jgi:glycosyltransferase involved in cell wall biosynthesis